VADEAAEGQPAVAEDAEALARRGPLQVAGGAEHLDVPADDLATCVDDELFVEGLAAAPVAGADNGRNAGPPAGGAELGDHLVTQGLVEPAGVAGQGHLRGQEEVGLLGVGDVRRLQDAAEVQPPVAAHS